jgi:hypothetical protein
LCSWIPPDGIDDAPDFRRGYAIACAIMAIILVIEAIAAAWLS